MWEEMEIKKTNGWYSADEMMEEGYETTFDRDFNGDNRRSAAAGG